MAGLSIYGFVTDVLAQDVMPVQGAVYTQTPGTKLFRMYIYEWNAGSPNTSSLVSFSADVNATDLEQVDPFWMSFDSFDGAVTLQAGKQYLIAVSTNGYGGRLPFYSTTGGLYGAARTQAGSFPLAAWEAGNHPDPIGTLTLSGGGLGPTIVPCIYVEGETSSTNVDNVNDDNIIVRNGPIVINGTFPAIDELTIELGGHPLAVESANATTIVCSPVDVFTTPLSFSSYPLVVTAENAAGLDVYLQIDQDHQVQTISSIDPPLLAGGLTAAIGDQLACPGAVAGSTLLLESGGDVLYTPAVPDDTTHPRYWYDVSVGQWDSGPVVINGGAVPGNPTITMFTVLTDTVGQATLRGTTDTTSGTIYAVVDANANRPTATQVRDGLNAAGAPALGTGSAPVTTTDLAVTITGLPSDTLLYGWLAQWV
jgi:hypothetical protein